MLGIVRTQSLQLFHDGRCHSLRLMVLSPAMHDTMADGQKRMMGQLIVDGCHERFDTGFMIRSLNRPMSGWSHAGTPSSATGSV